MSTAEGSSGGEISDLTIDQAAISQLFCPVTECMARTGWTDYRKVFAVNLSPVDTLESAGIWFLQQPGFGQAISLGLGGPSDTDGTVIAYSQPATMTQALALGAVVPNQAVAIWLQRVVPALTPAFKQPCFFQLGFGGQANLG